MPRSIVDTKIEKDEFIKRFILKEGWLKKTNAEKNSHFEAFCPYSRIELSVTREKNLTENQIWGNGRCACIKRRKSSENNEKLRDSVGLFGGFRICIENLPSPLIAIASEGPEKGPLNHVNIVGFPPGKQDQITLALKMAAKAQLVEAPEKYRMPPLRDDPHNLQRFAAAQSGDYETALGELRSGRKRTHWIWYIFPQAAGLGHSSMAQKYAIQSKAEAVAYLGHEILGGRLRECAAALLPHHGTPVGEIMGSPDDLKLRSSMTLFASISEPGSVFHQVLDYFYGGGMDPKTLEFLDGDL